ncbi:MAG: DUF1080 domain-containing protein [bacterium]|nr:DUF1080 domain-containing protein [bacterium]
MRIASALAFLSLGSPVLLGSSVLFAQEWQPLWNGKDLSGWHGQRHFSPYKLAAMSPAERDKLRAEDDASVAQHWRVENGELVNDGHGAFLTTDRDFGDVEFRLEYKTVAGADSGIYLRGSPQVQIWDYTEAGGKWKLGADKGSGGLWNNQKHERFPPKCYDRPFGEWNELWIRQIGARTWVTLNGEVTVDDVVMENYWDRKRALPARGPLQLQTHGGEIRFRNLQFREMPSETANVVLRMLARKRGAAAGMQLPESIFDGKTLQGWQGAVDDYEVVDGALRCKPGRGGNLFTAATYSNYVATFEFRLPAGGNNGVAIHYPGKGNPAREGFEIQVLDDTHEKYSKLKPWQYCGSVYGMVPSQRGYLRPVGEWNRYEITVTGSRVRVELNGSVIVDCDLAGLPSKLDNHVGKDRTSGHFGFCGHNDPVEFRDIRIRKLPENEAGK